MNGISGKYPKNEKQYVTRIVLINVISAEIVRRKNNDLDSYSNYIRLRFEGLTTAKLKIEDRYPIPSSSIIDTILVMHNIDKNDKDILNILVGKKIEALVASSNNWKSAIVVGFLNGADKV